MSRPSLGRARRSEEINQRVGCFRGAFLKDPVTAVFHYHDGDVIGHEFHLLRQLIAERLFAANRQDGHF